MHDDPYRRLIVRQALIVAGLATIVILHIVSPEHVRHAEIVTAFLWLIEPN